MNAVGIYVPKPCCRWLNTTCQQWVTTAILKLAVSLAQTVARGMDGSYTTLPPAYSRVGSARFAGSVPGCDALLKLFSALDEQTFVPIAKELSSGVLLDQPVTRM